MKQSQAEPVRLPRADTRASQGLELRHLRYFAVVADAGTFTHAAEQVFIAQPTLSQQIRRLEQLVGTPLLHRGPDRSHCHRRNPARRHPATRAGWHR
jgi:hypothetical protein